jgi:transcriptional regulator with XRE-family HTH domain
MIYFLAKQNLTAYYPFMQVNFEVIRVLREAMGLTLAELGARAIPPVPHQTVAQWERGGVKTLRTLNRVAQALGVKPEALLKKEG